MNNLASTNQGEAAISGGFELEGKPFSTVRLNMTSFGRRGHLLLKAELAEDPTEKNNKDAPASRLTAVLILEPALLMRFANQLSGVSRGNITEAEADGQSLHKLT